MLQRKQSLQASQASHDLSKDAADTAAEVAAFRTMLSRSFGNLTRAFRAMKNAAVDAGILWMDGLVTIQGHCRFLLIAKS